MAAERGSYTFDIMVDEFVTFVVAGMETTANSLALSMMELARRPDLVERFVSQTNDEKKFKQFILYTQTLPSLTEILGHFI